MLQCRWTLLGVFSLLKFLVIVESCFQYSHSVLLILIIIICLPLYQAAANGLPYSESKKKIKNAITL